MLLPPPLASRLFDPVPPPCDGQFDPDTVFGPLQSLQPPITTIRARDGVSLAARVYWGVKGRGIVIALHGSSLSALAMHPIADALQAAGRTVYALDLRGHGESGPPGDVGYRGQWVDDIQDWLDVIAYNVPGEDIVLLGHSQAGGFALKVAASAVAPRLKGVVALAPLLTALEPSLYRPGAGWANAAVPRIMALQSLNFWGISAYDHLPVVAYAVPERPQVPRTRTNSWRLLDSASLPIDWRTTVAAIPLPTQVLIGADDQFFVAANYPAALGAVNAGVATEVIVGLDHLTVTMAEPALTRIGVEVGRLLGG